MEEYLLLQSLDLNVIIKLCSSKSTTITISYPKNPAPLANFFYSSLNPTPFRRWWKAIIVKGKYGCWNAEYGNERNIQSYSFQNLSVSVLIFHIYILIFRIHKNTSFMLLWLTWFIWNFVLVFHGFRRI